MHFDGGTVQGNGFDLDTDDLIVLQLREYPIQYAASGPPIHAGIDRVPVAEPLGQTAPSAALFRDVQDGVQHPQIGQAHVAALCRQTVLDQAILRFGNLHSRSISCNRWLVLTRPSSSLEVGSVNSANAFFS